MRRSVLLCAALMLHSSPPVLAQDSGNTLAVPRVHIRYNPPGDEDSPFDRGCPQLFKTELNPEHVRETARRRAEFQARWDREGPGYLSAVFSEIGLAFPYQEMIAVLTVCPMGSVSTPLIINVVPYLASSSSRAPDWEFTLTLFHELMHTYAHAVWETSALRRKYAAESQPTRNNLHILALERLALERQGKTSELEWLDTKYRTRTSAPLRRAWEIVNDVEGAQAFIAELQQAARK